MKNLKFLLLTAAVLLSASAATPAQTADEIIQKHVAAIGGIDNWKKINTIKLTCSSNASGKEIPINIFVKQGKGFRVEYTVNGMTGYNIITNKAGWNYNPFAGQQKADAMPEEMVKQSQDNLDIQGPLLDYKSKGNKITYLGKDDVEGTDCYKLKVNYPDGKEETVYIDATSYYHIRSVEKITANGKEQEHISSYSNHQKLPEGIVYAMTIESGGGPVNISKVEINAPLDDKLFSPSETKAPDAKK